MMRAAILTASELYAGLPCSGAQKAPEMLVDPPKWPCYIRRLGLHGRTRGAARAIRSTRGLSSGSLSFSSDLCSRPPRLPSNEGENPCAE